jgi:hypothetical protein
VRTKWRLRVRCRTCGSGAGRRSERIGAWLCWCWCRLQWELGDSYMLVYAYCSDSVFACVSSPCTCESNCALCTMHTHIAYI